MLLIDLVNNWPRQYDIHLILLQNRDELTDLLYSNRRIYKHILNEQVSFCCQINRIRKYFKRNNIEFCLSHLERPNKICLFASFLTKTKVFPVIHSINIYDSTPGLNRIFASLIYRLLSKKMIAISGPVRDYCIKKLKIRKARIVQIDNGIDFKRIRKYKQALQFNGSINFATLGRLERVKGYDLLLEAMGNTKIMNMNWSLKIIGNGAEIEDLKLKASSLGISEKVVFTGANKHPFKLLSDVHFLVMPSRREGLPLSLLEALGYGIPVIVSNIGVLPYIIDNGRNGFVFESENIDMLEDLILHCLKIDPQRHLQLSLFAQKSVEGYSIDKCIKKYVEIIEN